MWLKFPYENEFITVTRENINEVPCLKFRPKGYKGQLPTVINYHGSHSSKEFKKFESLVIASNGYQVIVPDALYHGERGSMDYDNPESINKYLWKIIFQSVKESKKFIETIINEHEADPKRMGLIGDSMGAITSSGIFVDNPNLKCLVSLNGSSSWQEGIRGKYLPEGDSEDKKLIEHYNPMNNEDKIKERAVLILHGENDTSLPVDNQRGFFNKMQPLYVENPENIEFIEVSNIDHRITTSMLEKSIMWFKEHL